MSKKPKVTVSVGQKKIPVELKEEPSSSSVLINLNIGDMVVDIKPLKKKSNFNIESPVGVAGIRG